MIGRKYLIILTFIISISCLTIIKAASLTDQIVSARQNPVELKNYTNIHSNQAIPAEYSFSLGREEDFTSNDYTITGEVTVPQNVLDQWGDEWIGCGLIDGVKPSLAVDSIKGHYSVLYKKLDVYNDKIIDVKATVLDFETKSNARGQSAISLHTVNVGVSVVGIKWVKIKYEFFESGTNNLVSIKGNTTYWDVDLSQGVLVHDNNKGFYITGQNNLKANTISNYPYVFEKGHEAAFGHDSPEYAFSEIFEGSNITRSYQFGNPDDNWINDGGIDHSATPPIPIATPNPTKKVSQSNITNLFKTNSTYTYTVTQKVPNQISDNYYNSFVFKDQLENPLIPNAIIIKNEKGDDVTNLFTTSISGQTVTATLKEPSNAGFYGHTYSFLITTKVKSNLKYSDLSSYKQDNKFVIPNSATVTINGSNKNTSNVNVNIDYIAAKTPTKAVSQTDITNKVKNEETFKYTVTEEVPFSYYYNSFEFTDTLEKVLVPISITIKNELEEDVTSLFNTSISSQTVTATLKNPSNTSFYDHTYSFIIEAKVKYNLTASDVISYRNGTVYQVPNKASINIDNNIKETNNVDVYWYRGMCPGGNCSDKINPEPNLPPVKTVSTKYTNEITTFQYRISQFVPEYNSNYLWTSLIIKDNLDKALDMNNTKIKVIDTRYGNKDVSSGNDRLFSINIDNHNITVSALTNALTQQNFYGTTYEIVIETKIKDQFDFTGYTKKDGKYIIINNKAIRTFKDKNNNEYQAETPKVPTLKVDPKMPAKQVDEQMARPEHEFNYTITKDIQPATKDNYYSSFEFVDVLEEPLQIQNASKVKIIQINNETQVQTDYTNKFDIETEYNKISAKLINPKSADFYGTRDSEDKEVPKTYKFILTVSLKNNIENTMDMSKYIDQARYKIPNEGKFITTTKDNNIIKEKTNEVQIYYYPDPQPLKKVVQENVTAKYKNNEYFTYNIEKRILNYNENLWYNSFQMQDTLEDCLEANNIEIKNENGMIVTNWFNIKIAGQNVSATLKKDYNNENFYGHTYLFIIKTKFKKDYNLKQWQENNLYVIPNIASFYIDNKIEMQTNKKEVYIIKNILKVDVPITGSNIPFIIKMFGIILILVSTYIIYNLIKNKKLLNIKTFLNKDK